MPKHWGPHSISCSGVPLAAIPARPSVLPKMARVIPASPHASSSLATGSVRPVGSQERLGEEVEGVEADLGRLLDDRPRRLLALVPFVGGRSDDVLGEVVHPFLELELVLVELEREVGHVFPLVSSPPAAGPRRAPLREGERSPPGPWAGAPSLHPLLPNGNLRGADFPGHGPRFTAGAPASPGQRCSRVPSGPSSTTQPSASSSARKTSARAQSPAARAASRSATRSAVASSRTGRTRASGRPRAPHSRRHGEGQPASFVVVAGVGRRRWPGGRGRRSGHGRRGVEVVVHAAR